jgi:hypothetical protein
MGFDYSAYLNVCKQAIENDEIFQNFRRNPNYTGILEHVNHELGVGYIAEIRKQSPELIQYLNRFATSDKVGSPNIEYFEEIDFELAPSDLRYIKVLGDLIRFFGDLDELDIVEIGGGYGGQCKIIYDLYRPKSYTIIDVEEALLLTNKYLKEFSINPILQHPDKLDIHHHDLLISNYAFTEFDRNYQDLYIEEVINMSKRGYITCNFFGFRNDGALNKEEVFKLKAKGIFIPEEPLSGENNIIYIWGE